MSVDIEGLRAFTRIAELGAFHAAAKSLHISAPALSRRIARLESNLGVRLVDRTTRRVRLTAVGAGFLPRARRLVDELESSFADLRDAGKRGRGDVTLACVPTAAIQLLPAVIGDYSERHPNNRIRILDLHANEVLQSVLRAEAELGITGGTHGGSDEPEIESEVLFEESFVLACHADHPLARLKRVKWADLDRHRVIAVGRLSGNRPPLDIGFPDAMPRQRWTYEVQHSTWTGLGLAEAGIGVIAVPALALSGSRHPKLVSRPLIEPQISRTIVVIRRRDTTLSPAAAEFLRLLEQRWKKDAGAARSRRSK